MTSCDELRIRLATADRALELGAGTLEHALDCAACRSHWISAALLAEPPAESTAFDRCGRLDELPALFDDRSASHRRRALVNHVADCASCTRELASIVCDLCAVGDGALAAPPAALEAEALALHGMAARPRPIRLPVLALTAAAGLVLVATGVALLREGPTAPVPATGAGLRGYATAELRATAPIDALSTAEPVRFAWVDAAREGGERRDARYHLVVIDSASGATVIDAWTDRPSYVPSEEEVDRLRPGVRHHWIVERATDAGATTTAPRVFWLAEP